MVLFSSPSPREAVGREGRGEARPGWGVRETPPTPTLAYGSHRPSPPLATLAGGGIKGAQGAIKHDCLSAKCGAREERVTPSDASFRLPHRSADSPSPCGRRSRP